MRIEWQRLGQFSPAAEIPCTSLLSAASDRQDIDLVEAGEFRAKFPDLP
jgi:hypothetical protein